MERENARTVVGVYRTRQRARSAIEALRAAGVPSDAISVLAADHDVAEELADETGVETPPETGGTLSEFAGWLSGATRYAIPGVGPVLSTGMMASAFQSATGGPGRGAMTGALVGMGLPVDEAARYEDAVRSGGALVAVQTEDDTRYAEAERILATGEEPRA